MSHQSYNELAELAGGFIHEVKNHISTLGLNLQLLAEDFDSPQNQRERRAHERVNKLREECQRLVDVSNDFLRFARVKDLDLKPTELSMVVEDILDFFGPTAQSARIEIKRYLPSDLPLIPLDRGLFKQAILNLLLNAQQAMPEGGSITFQASRTPTGVSLSLIDTGKGMPPDVIARAFKPFFSTRPGGSGLGLPTTRKILEAHGGAIDIESAVGHGTKFTLHLPVPEPASRKALPEPIVLANLNGQTMPLSQVLIPALDRGFLFGDAVYEVIRVYRGRPWLLEDHFNRLKRSLEQVRIQGVDLVQLRRRMMETLQASHCLEATVYMQITRGSAPRSHAFPEHASPLEFLYVKPFTDPHAREREHGARLSLQPDLRWKRCDIKSTNLLGNVLALQQAKEAGAIEALLHTDDGTLTECSHTSFIAVQNQGLVVTPLGHEILPGCTRGFVLSLAEKLGIPIRESSLHRNDLPGLEEMFLTGTTSEVLPVVRVDDQPIGTGKPGPVTRRLQNAYNEAMLAWLGAEHCA